MYRDRTEFDRRPNPLYFVHNEFEKKLLSTLWNVPKWHCERGIIKEGIKYCIRRMVTSRRAISGKGSHNTIIHQPPVQSEQSSAVRKGLMGCNGFMSKPSSWAVDPRPSVLRDGQTARYSLESGRLLFTVYRTCRVQARLYRRSWNLISFSKPGFMVRSERSVLFPAQRTWTLRDFSAGLSKLHS